MTEHELHDLVKKYHVPSHIQAHMKKVSAVALFLGNLLQKNGETVNLIALRQAALLHDILKLCDFPKLDTRYFQEPVSSEKLEFWKKMIPICSTKKHILAAYELLQELQEPLLAEIVKKHRFNCLIEENEKPVTWEEKLLYYADKRVKHDQVVSIKERLIDGRKRYFPNGEVPKEEAAVEKALYALEQEICEKAGVKPEEINENSVKIYLD